MLINDEKLELLTRLASRVNSDGGWGYHIQSTSWTEPTSYALLALASARHPDSGLLQKGAEWLRRTQKSDGGWSPKPDVQESTWVTALVSLLPDSLSIGNRQNAAQWLLRQTPANATPIYRIREWMLGQDARAANDGWPWYPGTAAWVTPTCLTLLSLRRMERGSLSGARERIRLGNEFLLNRVCAEGGWNHGSSRALGYDLGSYPETTGLGLLATAGLTSPVIRKSIETAHRHWSQCRSVEGRSWLRLGLMAHGESDPVPEQPSFRPRDTVDLSLSILADQASQGVHAFTF